MEKIVPIQVNSVEATEDDVLKADLLLLSRGETRTVVLSNYPWLEDFCTEDDEGLEVDARAIGSRLVGVVDSDDVFVVFDYSEENIRDFEENEL
jgi:hypothetical protein